MRIHWAICLLLMLATVSITWYLRTKDMNFFPSEAPLPASVVEPETPFELTGPPAPPPVSEEALADPEVIVGLDHYRDYLTEPETLSRLFAILTSQGKTELAYLAGERMMEDPIRDKKDKRTLAEKMLSLSSEISPYVYDLNEVRELKLTLTGIAPELRERIVTELSQLIYESSGGLASPEIEFASGESSLTTTAGTSQSFTPLPEDADTAKIISRLYILLVTEMNKSGVSLPIWQATTAQEFTVALTRHSWVQLLPEPEVIEPATEVAE